MTEAAPIYETTWKAKYHDFLRSPSWKRQRERVLRRDGYKCRGCQGVPATQVHHTAGAYKYGRYAPDYLLVSLCAPCHERITKIDNGELKPWDFSEVEEFNELFY